MSRRIARDVPSGSLRSFEQAISSNHLVVESGGNDSEQYRRLTPTERIRLQIQQEAFQKGYAEGLQLGKSEGELHARQNLDALNDAAVQRFSEALEASAETVIQALDAWYEKAESALAGLAVVIAERIVQAELKASPEVVLGITREALQEVTHATSARIRVNPFGSEILRQHADRLLAAAHSLRNIEIVDDPSIVGGCVIETDGGTVDATVGAKLAAIAEAARRIS